VRAGRQDAGHDALAHDRDVRAEPQDGGLDISCRAVTHDMRVLLRDEGVFDDGSRR
jgi:hypothetical protein